MSEQKTRSGAHPFWDKLVNFAPIKWFCSLKICRKCMTLKPFQLIFNCEMITYIFYGVLTTAVNFAAFMLCCAVMKVSGDTHIDLSLILSSPALLKTMMMPLAANLIAWIIALVFAFVTNKFIVFGSRDTAAGAIIREFGSFTAARLFSFVCEELILFTATAVSFNLVAAKLLAAVLVVILNYIFSKLFIFKSKN
ncbi:MAG: GtrA family protein [Acutalibacteraceae bacterium]